MMKSNKFNKLILNKIMNNKLNNYFKKSKFKYKILMN